VVFHLRQDMASEWQREDIETCLRTLVPLLHGHDFGFDCGFGSGLEDGDATSTYVCSVLLGMSLNVALAKDYTATVRYEESFSWRTGVGFNVVNFRSRGALRPTVMSDSDMESFVRS